MTTEDVRRVAMALPRTSEHLVRDRVKFRVGRIVYVALSRDETLMGFAFPREERAALVASDPDRFLMPLPSDERFNWVRVRLSALDTAELTEIVTDAWRMAVPKGVAATHLGLVSPAVRPRRGRR
ncbi:MmcQ/YjbR family DNA-binding protein [Streptosporangium saharense]|uniref:MmcQ/YjbR family DNA-binding protein n=1 Tax=Streptosporangium saharense TaxID=1706840 RepID=UPI0036B01228